MVGGTQQYIFHHFFKKKIRIFYLRASLGTNTVKAEGRVFFHNIHI